VKKNIVFSLISILAIMIFFGTAALCNMCGIVPVSGTSVTTVSENKTSQTIPEETSAKKTVDEKPEEKPVEETLKKTTEETQSEDTEEIQSETTGSSTDSGTEAPLIDFEVENPDYNVFTSDEKTIYFNPSDLGIITSEYGMVNEFIMIGDTATPYDSRGRFAFDISMLAGKEITGAELKLINPEIGSNPCNHKGNIVIFYNDFLPGITKEDYFIQNVYGGPEIFAWDADPLKFSNDFLKEKVKERANSGLKLQFGIGFEKPWTSSIPNNNQYRKYKMQDIILTVYYTE
jgi:hypothetical protein